MHAAVRTKNFGDKGRLGSEQIGSKASFAEVRPFRR